MMSGRAVTLDLAQLRFLTTEEDQRLYSPEFRVDLASGSLRRVPLQDPQLEVVALLHHTSKPTKVARAAAVGELGPGMQLPAGNLQDLYVSTSVRYRLLTQLPKTTVAEETVEERINHVHNMLMQRHLSLHVP